MHAILPVIGMCVNGLPAIQFRPSACADLPGEIFGCMRSDTAKGIVGIIKKKINATSNDRMNFKDRSSKIQVSQRSTFFYP